MSGSLSLLRPPGPFVAPFFSHVAVVPPGATTIYVDGQNGVDEEGALVGGDDELDPPPLVTLAGVAALALPGALVEVSAIAAIVE
jgi:hypothetical protein